MGPNTVAFILNALNAIPGLVAAGANLVEQVGQLSAQIKTLQAEKRDPTAEEWSAQNQALADAIAKLGAAKS